MLKLTTKNLIKTAFVMFIIGVSLVIGCGGGGGGTGRQTLPGENPAGPVIIIGTGTGTGTSTGTGTGTGTGTDTTLTVSQKIDKGWLAMDSGNWGGAMLYFEDAINDTRATVDERREAYNGRGWSRVKYYNTLSGMSDFIQAGDLKESLLGYALGLIQQGSQSRMSEAVNILIGIGLDKDTYRLTLEHQAIGVSTAEARAMLAYAHFWRANAGDDVEARRLILIAKSEDTSATSSVAQIYNTLKAAGLSGI
ncbi:MAG: hypothetical protein CVV42_06565 [Candidatus Riflebacteria bacterium HGW-Riflebacteria-2]|jgi:hypothetical protein|nr:MAG: hypothetical protein CVV42_06565 [Candidatus Riflebacteria bacterium HGW-Riflebacteria-2]